MHRTLNQGSRRKKKVRVKSRISSKIGGRNIVIDPKGNSFRAVIFSELALAYTHSHLRAKKIANSHFNGLEPFK